MHTQLLAVAARDRVDIVPGPELVEYARHCRADLTASGPERDDPSEVLGPAIRYDGALLRLGASVGIETSTCRFTPPIVERRRLERELTARGIDLTVPGEPHQRAAATEGVAAVGTRGGRTGEPGCGQQPVTPKKAPSACAVAATQAGKNQHRRLGVKRPLSLTRSDR